MLRIVIYTLVFEQVALLRDDAWWSAWYGVLALDKFIIPLPSAGLWVLASYYLAQGLIVRGALRISKN